MVRGLESTARTGTEIKNGTGVEAECRIGIGIKSMTRIKIKNSIGSKIYGKNENEFDSKHLGALSAFGVKAGTARTFLLEGYFSSRPGRLLYTQFPEFCLWAFELQPERQVRARASFPSGRLRVSQRRAWGLGHVRARGLSGVRSVHQRVGGGGGPGRTPRRWAALARARRCWLPRLAAVGAELACPKEPPPVPVVCPSCRLHETTREHNLQIIRESLLAKLGFTQAPNTTGRELPPVPENMMQLFGQHAPTPAGLQGDAPQPARAFVTHTEEDDFLARTNNVIVFAR
ncbi:hypothetical protein EVAR_49234_1 [Eumeta japonica]|uniref:Uncharacterized protein n=1 Tax=Eumeta variegata TaxID=151549 RepID=A0A4C1YFN3_EUMVA|nr:hypothetical protein EVAR_49234_1 [Eumeta japonica]